MTTHPNDPALRSFVAVDPASDFPIQNLPYGVFSTAALPAPRVGVAIGNYVLDLWELEQDCRLDVGPLGVFSASSLNPFMALGPKVWQRTRARISELLRHDHDELRENEKLRKLALVPRADARLHLPITVAGYTDFYSSREHATNVGVMFRGKDNALQPNWLHMPIGYNGRASTVVVSGTDVRRPRGQLKPASAEHPSFGPSRRLDFELEMGAVIGQASLMGEMLSEVQAAEMIFGFVLLNDWSARDIQQWEYVPLGPFQGKAFATSISPWVVTRAALEPFQRRGPEQLPQPLPYLQQAQPNNYDIELEVGLRVASMNQPARIYLKKANAAACLKFPGMAASQSSWLAGLSGRFSKTGIRWRCAAGVRGTVIGSASAKSRGRSGRPNDKSRLSAARAQYLESAANA